MKIAQIAPPWIAIPPKNYGGTETVIHNLVEEQVAEGHDVTLFATGNSQTTAHLVPLLERGLHEDGVPWTDFQRECDYLQRALQYVRAADFDIVHTHLSSGGDMYLFPLLAALRVPHLTTLHSNLPFAPAEVSDEIKCGDFAGWAPYVPLVAISERARQAQHLPVHFIGVVHHGLPLEQFCRPLEPVADFFLWLGRYASAKGPHLAIEAARQARVQIVLAGTLTPDHDYYYTQIEPQIDNHQIHNHGPATYEQKNTLMSQARAFLNPITWEEPFGMVMAEAMAQGCPVISFARGAAPEIIRDGETGFLVNTLEEMVQAIDYLDELDRAKVRAYARQHFSCHTMARKYEHLYREVVRTMSALS
ncbi:glycosyltransferase family 4 protein [Dictyobacter alpinus]|nr:glycosyltransferase family 4 protein [Dictyobacter alpinus]